MSGRDFLRQLYEILKLIEFVPLSKPKISGEVNLPMRKVAERLVFMEKHKMISHIPLLSNKRTYPAWMILSKGKLYIHDYEDIMGLIGEAQLP